MAKVKIQGNQVTLPDTLRKLLSSAEVDSLEAEQVEDGVLIRPASAACRRAALRKIGSVQRRVTYTGPEPRPSPEDEETQIAELLAADKLDQRRKTR